MHEQLRTIYNNLQHGHLDLSNTSRLVEALHKMKVLPPPTDEQRAYCKQMIVDTMPDADKANKNFHYFEAVNRWQLLSFLKQDLEVVESVYQMLKEHK